jgi:hypothetical protein
MWFLTSALLSRAKPLRCSSGATIKDFERGSDCRQSTLHKWYRALEGAGVEFIDDDAERGPGVRMRHSGKVATKRK